MTITHSDAAKNAATAAVTALANAGKLVLLNVSDEVLATFTLPNPAFGAPTAGTATKGTISNTTGAAGPTDRDATHFDAQTTGSVKVWGGSVTASGGGGDCTLDQADTHISAGATVAVSTWTFRCQPT